MSLAFNPFTGNFDIVDYSPWVNFTDTITSSSIETIDTILLTEFTSATYMLTFFNNSENVSRNYELKINNSSGNLKDSISSRLGDSLNLQINAIVNSGNLELNITNNETFNLELSASKLIL